MSTETRKRRASLDLSPGMIKQFLRDVDWGEVDYLIVDTPPGTSDEHLSAVQYLSAAHVDGAVIITTPQVSERPGRGRHAEPCRTVSFSCGLEPLFLKQLPPTRAPTALGSDLQKLVKCFVCGPGVCCVRNEHAAVLSTD